jgi:hypothetical protein
MKLEMKFRFTNDEQACLYILKEKLKEDVNLRNKCDSAVLISMFERFIEHSMNATLLDPFINNEL